MTADQMTLTWVRLPARLDVGQSAALLGFATHDIPVLISAKLLDPLGKPSRNGHKFFSSAELVALAGDRKWLDKATKAVSLRWKIKNQRHHLLESGA